MGIRLRRRTVTGSKPIDPDGPHSVLYATDFYHANANFSSLEPMMFGQDVYVNLHYNTPSPSPAVVTPEPPYSTNGEPVWGFTTSIPVNATYTFTMEFPEVATHEGFFVGYIGFRTLGSGPESGHDAIAVFVPDSMSESMTTDTMHSSGNAEISLNRLDERTLQAVITILNPVMGPDPDPPDPPEIFLPESTSAWWWAEDENLPVSTIGNPVSIGSWADIVNGVEISRTGESWEKYQIPSSSRHLMTMGGWGNSNPFSSNWLDNPTGSLFVMFYIPDYSSGNFGDGWNEQYFSLYKSNPSNHYMFNRVTVAGANDTNLFSYGRFDRFTAAGWESRTFNTSGVSGQFNLCEFTYDGTNASVRVNNIQRTLSEWTIHGGPVNGWFGSISGDGNLILQDFSGDPKVQICFIMGTSQNVSNSERNIFVSWINNFYNTTFSLG